MSEERKKPKIQMIWKLEGISADFKSKRAAELFVAIKSCKETFLQDYGAVALAHHLDEYLLAQEHLTAMKETCKNTEPLKLSGRMMEIKKSLDSCQEYKPFPFNAGEGEV